MSKYKIKYWFNGGIKIDYVEADNIEQALVIFYINYVSDDVISIEVSSDV